MKHEQLIKVAFKGNRREYFKNPMSYPIQEKDFLVVETEKGYDMGEVSAVTENYCPVIQVSQFEILRKADQKDIDHLETNRRDEENIKAEAREKIAQLGLVMKLMDVEYQLDRKKLTFFYTADERVDFRELVRSLAGMFRTRIEMRQIGVRDETKRISGIGSCGLPLCCGTFLESFDPVSTQIAKDQGLPMNPAKLSGQCGKLKCCLLFEHKFYIEELAKYPIAGEPVMRDKLRGHIEKIDIFTKMVSCHFSDGTRDEIPYDEVKDMIIAARRKGIKRLTNVLTDMVSEEEIKKIEDR